LSNRDGVSRGRTLGAWWALGLAACIVGALACEPKDPCPEGYRSIRAVCQPLDAGFVQECEFTGDYTGFGDPCTDQDDCSCPANVCNDQSGHCTQLNCMDEVPYDGGTVTICPPDWTCANIAGLPGVPEGVDSICLQ
jgi:hypothetical protein